MNQDSIAMRQAVSSDHYHILGVSETAGVEQIKAAYRRKALRLHPDKNPESLDAEERFKRCSEAYAVLSDPERRWSYDVNRKSNASAAEIVGDLLGEFVKSIRKRPRRGRDLRFDLALDFAEGARGVKRRISYTVVDDCRKCNATGAAPGGHKTCRDCDGRGDSKLSPHGLLPLRRPCSYCGGQGLRVAVACDACNGVGKVELRRQFVVSIESGARDGELKVVRGQGDPGANGGQAGDLKLTIKVAKHPLLRRDRADIRLDLPLSYATAALGGRIEVPTLDGRVRMTIPAGTQSGRTFRLRGKGILLSGAKGLGDQLVHIHVETPTQLKPAQTECLRHFADALEGRNEPLQAKYTTAVEALIADE